MSDFLNAMKNATNFTYTENGALTHKSTGTDLYDMFALVVLCVLVLTRTLF